MVSSNVVPGDGGSRIEAKLNKTWVPHYFCYKKSDWFELWLNVHYLAPEAIDCWADNMRLRYDSSSPQVVKVLTLIPN